jgi:transaldolase
MMEAPAGARGTWKGRAVRIYIDSADEAAIVEALASGYVYGVTTNPTILRRAGARAAGVPALARMALAAGARELHLQVYSDDTAAMVREGRALAELDPQRVVVKIPATAAGYAAAAQLAADRVRVTLTAVYTIRQAILAASVGAAYIAVYVGRMGDAGLDALGLVAAMQRTLDAQHAPVAILAASIRDAAEIEALALAGVATVTLPPPVLSQLLDSPLTAAAAASFGADAGAIL